ncbi:hypothetical protein QBC36DRAFT_366020 [Triangularia setosa]|uniref:Uncharacterized protein n=1 Tax=Triangularia setosa TaxID=2587417 RepID=A0AAN7AA20_9PEZI|nr:hypothetical protein QBC36DRAFT_366020 [Podospora setosa]
MTSSQSQQQTEPLRLTPHHDDNDTTAAPAAAAEEEGEQEPGPPFTSPYSLLKYLYADVARFRSVASENCVLHPADRSADDCVGVEACQRHEENLLKATRGTLQMRVEQMTVSSSREFGCVMGQFELGAGGEVRESFCGVWRFETVEDEEKGKRKVARVVEHWENLTPEGGRRVAEWRPKLKLNKLGINRQFPHLLNTQIVQIHISWLSALSHLNHRHPQDVSNILGVLLLYGCDLPSESLAECSKLGDVLLVKRSKSGRLGDRQGISKWREGRGDECASDI